jgi:GTPase
VPQPTHFARIAITGRPNAGKSSLLNAMIDAPLAIVSPRAQASRHPVTGLVTRGDTQLLLVDLPGLLEPAYPLHHALRRMAIEELRRAHVVVYLHPAAEAPAPPLQQLAPEAASLNVPIVTVYTKSDLNPADGTIGDEEAMCTSIHRPESIARLFDHLLPLAPEGPWRHPTDDLGTQPARFFVGEYLREAAFAELRDELPYAMAVEVDEFRETSRPVYIRATLFVERESQKGIVIGRKGSMLRAIGSHARRRLETLLDTPVHLETWVKVLPDWRRRDTTLKRFGFATFNDESR